VEQETGCQLAYITRNGGIAGGATIWRPDVQNPFTHYTPNGGGAMEGCVMPLTEGTQVLLQMT